MSEIHDTYPTTKEQERAFLVAADFQDSTAHLSVDDSLDELERLADTAGLEVVGRVTQKLAHPHQATFIGPGKVSEIKMMVSALEIDVVLFDDELSPRHQRELEKAFDHKTKVLDRTALILDIFAQHASTREGKLQVELAQLEYRIPRLTRMWTHLARQGGSTGGSVGLRGPGEKQLEMDKRMIQARLKHLKADLEEVKNHRARHRRKRQQTELQVVAIVGYTNAGKSTLLNQLAGADVLSADKLFATLDPTTRKVDLPGGREILFTDTVGFIQKLPTDIVASFRATLEEIIDADIILHVADATHPHVNAQIDSVKDTLAELEVDHLPTILAYNKIDGLNEEDLKELMVLRTDPTVYISGMAKTGFEDLLYTIQAASEGEMLSYAVFLPYTEGSLMSLYHERGRVEREVHTEDGFYMLGKIPPRLAPYFEEYQIEIEKMPQ